MANAPESRPSTCTTGCTAKCGPLLSVRPHSAVAELSPRIWPKGQMTSSGRLYCPSLPRVQAKFVSFLSGKIDGVVHQHNLLGSSSSYMVPHDKVIVPQEGKKLPKLRSTSFEDTHRPQLVVFDLFAPIAVPPIFERHGDSYTMPSYARTRKATAGAEML
eukprot:138466-Amphidinium_carterae.2